MTQAAVRSQPVETTSSARRLYGIFIALTVFFIFLQSLTAGEFIEDGLPQSTKEAWTTVHGFIAYPVMVFALVSAIVAFRRLRDVRGLAALTALLFVGCVVQWLLGHAITTLGMDWVVPFHVVLAFAIYGIAVWLAVRAVSLNRREKIAR